MNSSLWLLSKLIGETKHNWEVLFPNTLYIIQYSNLDYNICLFRRLQLCSPSLKNNVYYSVANICHHNPLPSVACMSQQPFSKGAAELIKVSTDVCCAHLIFLLSQFTSVALVALVPILHQFSENTGHVMPCAPYGFQQLSRLKEKEPAI